MAMAFAGGKYVINLSRLMEKDSTFTMAKGISLDKVHHVQKYLKLTEKDEIRPVGMVKCNSNDRTICEKIFFFILIYTYIISKSLKWRDEEVSAKLLVKWPKGDLDTYKNLLRMTEEKFEEFLQKVTREVLPARPVVLRYLAIGLFLSLGALYRLPKNTISQFVPEVCRAIYHSLEELIKVPVIYKQWNAIENDSNKEWNFPT
nr:unnamed protein product [Callosobruchus analis]